jgi:hypothetical protein
MKPYLENLVGQRRSVAKSSTQLKDKEKRGEEVKIDSSTKSGQKRSVAKDQARNQKQRAVWLRRNR